MKYKISHSLLTVVSGVALCSTVAFSDQRESQKLSGRQARQASTAKSKTQKLKVKSGTTKSFVRPSQVPSSSQSPGGFRLLVSVICDITKRAKMCMFGFTSPLVERPSLYALVFLLFEWRASLIYGQGSFDVVRTGTVIPSTVLRTGLTVSEALPQLQFRFGFGTDEEIEPEVFLDSVTGSLQSADSLTAVVILFTADRTGNIWAPNSPGAIFIEESAIQWQPTAFPKLEPQFKYQSSFEVVVTVPTELRNRSLNFSFDLFDNENSTPSLGWISEVAVVPEPNFSAVILGFCGWMLWRRRRA